MTIAELFNANYNVSVKDVVRPGVGPELLTEISFGHTASTL